MKSVLPLRGSDPMLLEIQLDGLVSKPLNQIALVNVMDIIELASTDGRPKALDRKLQGFITSLSRQIADIPKGRAWDLFIEELETLDGKQVPHLFRKMFAEYIEQSGRTSSPIEALLERWSQAPPEPFPLSVRTARIQRAELVLPKSPQPEPSSAPRERGERGERKERAPKEPAAPRPKPAVDIDRQNFVIEQCLERLARSPEKGLAEMVLVAGVKHAANGPYPDMAPVEITGVLKQLRDANRVRFSAGRWTIITRF